MTKPTRIEPKEPGQDIDPPSGGSWLRDADGGLTPGDAQTAKRAGLAWGDEPPDEQPVFTPDAAPAADPVTTTTEPVADATEPTTTQMPQE